MFSSTSAEGLTTALAAAVLVLLCSSPVSAQGEYPEAAASLNGYYASAGVMVDGGRSAADTVDTWVSQCADVHYIFDAYLTAEPWLDPEAPFDYVREVHHRDTSNRAIESVRFWTQVSGDVGPLPEVRVVFFCSQDQQDGWLPVSAGDVQNKVDSPVVEVVDFDGEVFCEPGSVIVGSATYYFSWQGGQGRWVYGLGRSWVYTPNQDRLIEGEVSFRCVEILTEPQQAALLIERVPDTPINVNPALEGLTGLDTWLWYDTATATTITLPVTVDARGGTWPLTVRAWIDQVMWDVDCTTACAYRGPLESFDTTGYEYTTDFEDRTWGPAAGYDGGGESAEHALHTHSYRTRGAYTLSTATIWRGSYEYAGILHQLDPVTVAATRPYPVISITADLQRRPRG